MMKNKRCFIKEGTLQPTPFIKLPYFVLEDHSIPVGAKLLYSLILYRARLAPTLGWIDKRTGAYYVEYCYEQCARDLGISMRTISSWLKTLEQRQYILRINKGYKRTSHIYPLIPSQIGVQSDACLGEKNLPAILDRKEINKEKDAIERKGDDF